MLIAFILTISLSVVKVYLHNIVNMMEYDESPSKLNMNETAFSNDGNFRPVMFKAIYTCIHLNVDMKQLIN